VHELGITEGIVERAREAARERGAQKITDIYVVMTPAADFTEDSVLMYFSMLIKDDEMLRGATMHVEHGSVSAVCLECNNEFNADAPEPACAQCGSQSVRLDPETPMIQLTDIVVEEDERP
jgi:Zn finger protein HypA/HybF involved in hydrogenase expression